LVAVDFLTAVTATFRVLELPDQGKIIELPLVCGLHHRYVRQAAA
jgi:hypothetical protein